MISKNLLLVAGDSKLKIVDVNSHNIIRTIDVPGTSYILSICLLNSNILLTADDNHGIIQWKIENDNLKLISKKENAHDRAVRILIKLGPRAQRHSRAAYRRACRTPSRAC